VIKGLQLDNKEGQRREYELKRREFALRAYQSHSQTILRTIGLAVAGNLAGAAFIVTALRGAAKPIPGMVIAIAIFVVGALLAVLAILFEVNASSIQTSRQIEAASKNFPSNSRFVGGLSLFRLLALSFVVLSGVAFCFGLLSPILPYPPALTVPIP
jgi:hypothetical protein